MFAKVKTHYQCSACEAMSPVLLGKCPECGQWGTLQAVVEAPPVSSTESGPSRVMIPRLHAHQDETSEPSLHATSEEDAYLALQARYPSTAQAMGAITQGSYQVRFSTGLAELDRVLGGGLVPDAFILIGGEPGIGKSTLSLQMAGQLASQGHRVLYLAAEESASQVKGRSDRLGVTALLHSNTLFVVATHALEQLLAEVLHIKPHILIVDSIQAIASSEVSGVPSSANQVKACAHKLQEIAKHGGCCVVMIGHVTKEGGLAGPKQLEHVVDTVLHFEGDRYQDLRLLRSVKNRFGTTQELGLFSMGESGLTPIQNPSERFLSHGLTADLSGCVTTCTTEGTRMLLVELQALVGATAYHYPKRMVNGLETNRIHQIVAVLERKLGLDFSRHDVYVNAVGGLDIREPCADLATALALVGSLQNLALRPACLVLGEVGLTGEIRPVPQLASRLKEALQLGFATAIVPNVNVDPALLETFTQAGMTLLGVSTVMDAIPYAFPS
ncbi:MAG: DNA repair protein RadA [Vampirovibrionales bacterium]